MGAFIPSKYQKAVYIYIQKGKGNAVIDAVAGSGKSTTIVNALKLIPNNKRVLFLAFNKAIVEELKIKVGNLNNVDIKTLHSLGASATMRALNSQLQVDKYTAWVNNGVKYSSLTPKSELLPEQMSTWKQNILKLIDLGRVNLVKAHKDLEELAWKHNIDLEDNEVDIAIKGINWGENETQVIDFTDMIYFPNVKQIKMFQYDWVFIDECQDLNAAQRNLFLKCLKPNGRFVAVGDPRQCQPSGTKILTTLNGEVNIENLKIGDKLVSYDKGGKWIGLNSNHQSIKHAPIVESIVKSKYNDLLYCVDTNSSVSKYTYNHICMVRFNPMSWDKKYVVYLMSRDTKYGTDWRIGKSKLYSESVHEFGLRHRLLTEKGDKIWILKICKDDSEARIWEEIYSTKYGISQKCFTTGNNDNKTFGEEKNVKFVFSMVRKYVNKRVDRLFKDLDKRFDFPFIDRKEDVQKHFSKKHMFECRACNLFSKDMQVFTENGWVNFSLYTERYNGFVYSLKVSRTEMYVADSILTHNCIYGFAGADVESFNILKTMPHTVKLPLSVCYRCDGDIIGMAKEIVPQIEARAGAPAGVVSRESVMADVKDGDMILCRVSAPLVKLCMQYIGRGVKAYVKGRDIGTNLINMIKKTNRKQIKDVMERLERELSRIIGKVVAKQGCTEAEAKEHEMYKNYEDKLKAIEVLSEGLTTSQEVIDRIEMIFSDNKNGICLSTIHKSKGLESDRVFIICEDKLYLKYCMTVPWMAEQERNLVYVAITRAKHFLGFIKDFSA